MRTLLLLMLLLSGSISFTQVDHWETVVYENDTWRYLVPVAAVSPAWNTIGFNDASWNTGPGGFGFGDGDDNTTIPSTISCYQRITFNIVDANAVDQAVFNIDYDDAYVAYLNGVEISRSNISSAGQPAYNQLSDGQHEAQMYTGGSPDQVNIDNAFITANLVTGNNVLCIQTHNATAGSSDMSSRVWLTLGINNTSTNYGTPPGWFMPPLVFTDSNLPIVVINTVNGQAIPDTPKIDATMGIIYNGPGVRNYMTDPFNEYFGDIGIETRGSSSQGFPKKQYGLETRDPMGNSNDVTIFNMAYDNDWVLFAPYSDKALFRNLLAYEMGWQTGNYAPRTKLCEVVLNGQYDGVYIFTEKIKRKDGKVGTNDIEPQDTYGNEITGDYIIKVDKFTAGGVQAWASPIPPFTGATQVVRYQMHDPSIDSLVPAQLTYIQNYVTNFENALDGPNFADPILGYQPYIDINSFVHFFLVNEVSKNVDGYRISSFLNKVRVSEGGKLKAGPLWDFNLAFGNANYCAGGNTSGWELDFYTVCSGDGYQNPFYWKKLLQDTIYTHELNCTYQSLRQGKWHTDTLMARIDTLAAYLDEAQQRNFQRWPVLGNYVWPNNFIGNTYSEEVDYLKTWLTNRLLWLDANMYGSCPDLGVEEVKDIVIQVYPNPASSFVEMHFDGMDKGVTIQLLNQAGQIVKEVHTKHSHHVLDVRDLKGGLYIYRFMDSGMNTKTGKISIVK